MNEWKKSYAYNYFCKLFRATHTLGHNLEPLMERRSLCHEPSSKMTMRTMAAIISSWYISWGGNILIMVHFLRKPTHHGTFLEETYSSWYISWGNLLIMVHFLRRPTHHGTFLEETYSLWYISWGNILIMVHFLRKHTHYISWGNLLIMVHFLRKPTHHGTFLEETYSSLWQQSKSSKVCSRRYPKEACNN